MKRSQTKRESNWKSIVENFNKSGVRAADYCRYNNICPSTLSTWRVRYRKHSEDSRSSGFDEIKFSPSVLETDIFENIETKNTGIVLSFGSKIKLKLTDDFRDDSLFRILKVLSSVYAEH